MRELKPPDNHHLNAATGWLELGNHTEAKAELVKMSVASRQHPDALELEWRISTREKNWPDALEAARGLVQTDPDSASGWIHQSYSLHEMKRTREAFDLLLPTFKRFPEEATIPYNLACYACQLGDLEGARDWLAKAIEIRGKENIKKAALDDPDLERMWEEIREL